MWRAVEGFEKRKRNGKPVGYFIDGQRVSETAFKRRYARALEAENQRLHEKLAAIYEIL